MRILLVDWTWGIHGGPEEFLMGINKDLLGRGIETRIVQEDSWRKLFIETQKNLSWADIICTFAFPASLMVGFTKKPCVWICYDVTEAFYRWYKIPAFWINRKIWSMPNRKIVCSNVTDAYSLEVIYRRKVDYIVPLSVDVDFYTYVNRNRTDKFRICQVGTILRNKNQLETIEVFNRFLDYEPNAELVLAGPRIPTGSGPAYWAACEDKIHKYHLDGKVLMPGHLKREQVRNLYYMSDIFINNLRGTGGWLAVLEALSTGLPVVSSRWFFGWEYIHPSAWVGSNMFEGLKDVHDNYPVYLEKAKQASDWIRQSLTHKNYVDKLLKVFKEV